MKQQQVNSIELLMKQQYQHNGKLKGKIKASIAHQASQSGCPGNKMSAGSN
jgi:hypothetical protein